MRKIARVATADARQEEKSARITAELRQELNLPLAFQNFPSQGEATDWLLSPVLA